MKDRIDALSPEQAQEALLEFYELLPDAMWGHEKPPKKELKSLAEDLRDEVPDDVRPQVEALMGTAIPEARGAVAKLILIQLDAIDPFHPYVSRAVDSAGKARMVALPLIAGAALVVLAVLPKVTRNTDGTWSIEFDPAGNMTKLTDSLTEFVKALPKALLSSLTG